jgi:lysophospholipase L1-like esterase
MRPSTQATRAIRWIAVVSLAINAALIATWAVRHLRARGERPPSRERARAELFHALAGDTAGAAHQDMHPDMHRDMHREIVALGDSLTDRGEWWELLGRPVANRGIAGDTVEAVRARLDDVVALAPRIVLLQIGINDLLAGAAPEALAVRHAALVAELRRRLPRARIVAESLLPIRDDLVARDAALTTATVQRANRLLEPAAAAAGAEWLDAYHPLADPAGQLDRRFSSDGLHLSAAGYQAWARALAAYLAGADPTAAPPQQ